jgi:hypothetical protein
MRGRLLVAALVLAGVFGWFCFLALFRGTYGQDWMVFDTIARAYWRGDAALMLDDLRLMPVVNADHPILAQPLTMHHWVYPPTTLLLALPFGLLPWLLSYGAFIGLSFLAMAVALRPWLPNWQHFVVVLAGVVLCPAAAYTLCAGQNSFLSAALLLGGVWCLGPNPFLAGLLLGLLAYKPQLGLLIPVALIAARAWRAFAGATAIVLFMLLVSLAVPGITIWRGFLHLFFSGQQTPRLWVELYGQSMFTYLRLAGAPTTLANAGQAVAVIVAAYFVWRAFRAPFLPHHKLVVLLCAICFASPHFGDYDAVLLGIAAMLLLVRRVHGDGWGVTTLACLVWCSTAINPPYLFYQTIPPLFPIAELTPVAVLWLLLYLTFAKPRAAAVIAAA